MNLALKEGVIARQPQRLRTRARFDQILDTAQTLLRDEGLSAFSIPVLADRLGYTRASIYKFFPTPYAVLNELVQRQLSLLEQRLARTVADSMAQPWPEAMRAAVFAAVEFYNENPVARLLILGGPATHDSYRALELTVQRLGGLIRQLLAPRGIHLPTAPDVATLLVETGTGCFRVSQFLHGRITPQYRDEAAKAMGAYLALYAAEQTILPAARPRLRRVTRAGSTA